MIVRIVVARPARERRPHIWPRSWLTLAEVARELAVHPRTVEDYFAEQRFAHVRRGGGRGRPWLIASCCVRAHRARVRCAADEEAA